MNSLSQNCGLLSMRVSDLGPKPEDMGTGAMSSGPCFWAMCVVTQSERLYDTSNMHIIAMKNTLRSAVYALRLNTVVFSASSLPIVLVV